MISRVAAYLQGEANAAIRYERPALAPVERVTESGIVVLNERLKANRQTGGEAFLYRNCLRSARLIAETRCAKGRKQWPNTRWLNK